MSGKPDLVLDEPTATGWLRAEFFGDEEAGKEFLGDARKQLGQMKTRYGVNDRVANGEPGGFYRQLDVLPDGTQIETLTNDGHDTVRITASSQPPVPPVLPEIPPPESTSFEGEGTSFAFEPEFAHKEPEYRPLTREYCIWEADQEAYSPPLFGHHIYGPMVNDKDAIYMGGWLNGVYAKPSYQHESRMYQYDPVTMEQGGAFELAFPAYSTQRMQWDLASKRFFLFDIQAAFATTIYNIYGVTYWDAGDNAARITLPSAANRDEAIHESYVDVSMGTINGRMLFSFLSPAGSDLYGVETNTLTQGTVARRAFGAPSIVTCPTPDGDLIVVEGESVVTYISSVRRIGLVSGRNASYPLPPTRYAYPIEIACSGGGVLWMLQSAQESILSPIVLYRLNPNAENPAWEAITVEGGFGTRDMSIMNSLATDVWTDYDGGLQHDPISDAVTVLMADGSGAWVFNATDCLGVPIPDFFYPFERRPDAEVYVATRGQQLYNGRLLVRYEEIPHNLGFEEDTLLEGHNVIGASYVIGLLRQTKIQEDAGIEPVLSSL